MVRISAVLGIVCCIALAGGIFASTKVGGMPMLCIEVDCDIEQDVVCSR